MSMVTIGMSLLIEILRDGESGLMLGIGEVDRLYDDGLEFDD